jgi:hypothetical protein
MLSRGTGLAGNFLKALDCLSSSQLTHVHTMIT